MATEQTTLRVGTGVHYYWLLMGFLFGPCAAIATRVYRGTAEGNPLTRCIDVAIFPQYGDHDTPRGDCMVWHRDDPLRPKDDRMYWLWPEEESQ